MGMSESTKNMCDRRDLLYGLFADMLLFYKP